jgi:predicted dehydrogenase/nucleoside-diphosphate-sugar epimerase
MTESTSKFRSAIIGAGHICPFHIAGIRRSGLAEVAAICDLNQPLASELARQHNVPHVVERVADLKELGVDVIHVATPPQSHFSLTMEALDSGCHVFVEKPLATSVEQCEMIKQRAAEVNRQVCANHSNLLDPFIARAIGMARAGRIGDVHSVTYLRSSNYPPYRGGPLPPHYRDGGFPFRDIGVHALYLFQSLLGDVQDVKASFHHRGADPNLMFDDWTGTVICERGTGLFHLSWNTRPLQNMLIITGTRGIIHCDPFSMFVTTRRKTKLPNAADRILQPGLEACHAAVQIPWNLLRAMTGRVRRYHGVQDMIRQFYTALRNDRPVPVTVDDATAAVLWTEHAAQQADREKQRRMARVPALSGADVLVTGGMGFIGRQLLKRLLEKPTRVRVLTRNEPPQELLSNNQLEFVVGDLGDPHTVDRAVAGVKLVYHLGAAMKGPPEDFERATELGTQHVVDAVLAQKNTQLVHVSSLSVLHSSLARAGDIIDENWPLEPHAERRGNYTLYKLRAEQIVSAAVRDRGLRAIIIRPGQVFGSGAELLTPAVARRIGSRFIVLGDGSVPLPLIYIQDLVDGLVTAAEHGPFDGTVLQFVDDTASIDQNELLRRMIQLTTGKVTRVPLPIVYSLAGGVQTLCGLLGRSAPLSIYRVRSALSTMRFDTAKARRLIGWHPNIGVEQGLQECVSRRYVSNPI